MHLQRGPCSVPIDSPRGKAGKGWPGHVGICGPTGSTPCVCLPRVLKGLVTACKSYSYELYTFVRASFLL